MSYIGIRRVVLCGAVSALLTLPSQAALEGYWSFDELINTNIAPNLVETGTDAELFNGFALVDDALRGKVISFDGGNAYGRAGTIAGMTLQSDFTWSFWSYNEEPQLAQGANPTNTVIIGNRYDVNGQDPTNPREFIKATNAQFEVHQNGGENNINYPDMPTGQWVYNTIVKDGDRLLAYRNGVVIGFRTLTAFPAREQPLYFGGDRTEENWKGKLDDVAIWTDALPAATVRDLHRGKVNPLTAPVTAAVPNYNTVFSEDFSGNLNKWFETDRGLEKNIPAGYDPAEIVEGVVSLGGTANAEHWAGRSLESVATFSASEQTLVSVDRVSIQGGGTGGTPEQGRYRSSVWLLGDDNHYFHFSQNVGEGGWSWNFKDENGVPSTIATGSGANIPGLDSLDTNFGEHKIQLELVPLGPAGNVLISAYVDGMLFATQEFTAFPDTFRVVLTGQARAILDFVDARFDNVLVQQVPEPSTALLLGGALVGFAMRRRRK